MSYTAARKEQNGSISSVVRCASLKQLREWSASNGHQIMTGRDAKRAVISGACVRLLGSDGRVRF
jgi:hypothetical protein